MTWLDDRICNAWYCVVLGEKEVTTMIQVALCYYARYRTKQLLRLARPDACLSTVNTAAQDTRHAMTITRELNSPAIARKTWLIAWTRHGLSLEPYPMLTVGNVAPEGQETWN